MDIIKKNFGECLKNIRKIRNYTQEQLSEKIGINLRQLSRIEAGDSFITSETLYKICTILKVSPWELFNFDIQDNYLMTGTGNVVYLNAIKTGSTRHIISKPIAESTFKQQSDEEIDFDTKMLNMSKSLSKEIIVDEIRDGVYCNTKKYYPNGEIKTENKNMKQIIILIVFFLFPGMVNAQTKIEIGVGVADTDTPDLDTGSRLGLKLGIGYEYNLSPILGIEPAIVLENKGKRHCKQCIKGKRNHRGQILYYYLFLSKI